LLRCFGVAVTKNGKAPYAKDRNRRNDVFLKFQLESSISS
jgi:hypothetical protein